jgi:hypothetical protein
VGAGPINPYPPNPYPPNLYPQGFASMGAGTPAGSIPGTPPGPRYMYALWTTDGVQRGI